MLLKIGITS